jgi:hypothetical protein
VIDPPDDADGALLADLGAAQAEAASVPVGFVAAARGALAWHTIDSDLAIAELTFDSARDAELATRSGGGPVRLLAFGTGDITLEFEVTAAGTLVSSTLSAMAGSPARPRPATSTRGLSTPSAASSCEHRRPGRSGFAPTRRTTRWPRAGSA